MRNHGDHSKAILETDRCGGDASLGMLLGRDASVRYDETFLAWAKQPWACTVLNLHVSHRPQGIEQAAAAFRRLIDLARKRGGSYFLTYHKWAGREQVEACYPQLPEFLKLKRRFDPNERFQSDWYRHYRTMFADKV